MRTEVLRLMNYTVREADRKLFLNFWFSLREGEVHAIAGLSAEQRGELARYLTGATSGGSGNLFLSGRAIRRKANDREALREVQCIFPESILAESMSVAENLYSLIPKGEASVLIRHRNLYRRGRVLMDRYGLSIDPESTVKRLSQFEKSAIELLKLLEAGARVIVFNREIRQFGNDEIESLKKLLSRICKGGVAVLLLTGSLRQQILLADRITAVSGAYTVKCFDKYEASETLLRSCILRARGISLEYIPGKQEQTAFQVSLEAFPGLECEGEDKTLSFRYGEVVGFLDVSYDLIGRLMEYFRDQAAEKPQGRRRLKRAEVLYVDDLINREHFVTTFSVRDNINLEAFCRSSYPGGILRKRFLASEAESAAQALGIGDRTDDFLTEDLLLPVQMCRIAISPAYIVLLSRPFVDLSVSEEERMKTFLIAQAARGRCILFTTTNYADIGLLCSRWYEVRGSRLVEQTGGL